jgi:hypothetical protein
MMERTLLEYGTKRALFIINPFPTPIEESIRNVSERGDGYKEIELMMNSIFNVVQRDISLTLGVDCARFKDRSYEEKYLGQNSHAGPAQLYDWLGCKDAIKMFYVMNDASQPLPVSLSISDIEFHRNNVSMKNYLEIGTSSSFLLITDGESDVKIRQVPSSSSAFRSVGVFVLKFSPLLS